MLEGRETQVLISGAGPTGLLLAAELRRRDVDCMLVDELDSPQAWDRATVVHPRSMEIFEALGLADSFLNEGVRTRAARFESGGEVLGELDLELSGARYGFDLGLSEETTERLLTHHLESVGGSVTRSTRLVGFDQRPKGVSAALQRDGTTFKVEADWLVGCDGLHSVVREASGIEFAGTDNEARWAVFDASVDGWPREYDVAAAFLDRPPVIMTPLPGRHWRVYLCPTSDDGDLVAEASGVLHRYAPNAEFVGIENRARFRCHSRVAAKFRDGRVLLAGDAAHACSPSEGHGMNTGLQDAFNLGWKLALVCRGEAGERLLDSYEIERRPVAERIAATGADFEAAQELAGAARSERDAGMRETFGNPEPSHHEAAAAAEIDRSYADSPIVSGRSSNGVTPGRLVPDGAAVEHPDAGSVSLHELAHRPGHTVIVIGGPGAEPAVVAELVAELERTLDGSVEVAAIFGFSTRPGEESIGRIDEAAAKELGIDGVTVLVIRPDRYVGLRRNGADAAAVGRYFQALAA